ncbi:MAG: tRNA-intron lyase [Candidatus Lokiarchaeota archaeon]|nr:tRNA-intron lyase [Candidatus Lokiarchaeota archaeon]
MEEFQNDEIKKEEKETYQGKFSDDKIIILPPDSTNLHEKGYYGTLDEKNNLILEPVECLLLIERKRLELYDEKKQLMTLQKLIEIFIKKSPNDFWTNYLVYKDLRNRGYIVKKGVSLDTAFRVYKRGAKIGEDTSKFLVTVIIEGTPISLTNLDEIVISAKSVRKNLILAVVDRQGEVTYYNCSSFEINPITREN